MADSFAQFARKLEQVERDMSDRATLTRLGMGAKDDFAEAVRGDFGDLSMSNWRRGRPIEMQARFTVSASEVTVEPAGRARGPVTVAERGRRAGVSNRRASRGRRYGASAGKGTWTDAEKLMVDRTPKRAHDELVKSLRKLF